MAIIKCPECGQDISDQAGKRRVRGAWVESV